MSGSSLKLRDLSDVKLDPGTTTDEAFLVHDAATGKFGARLIADTDIPATIARDTEVTAAIAASLAAGITVGGATNKALISSAGRLTLEGNGRVRKHISIPIDGLGAGGTAPTITRLGNTYGYAFTILDDGYVAFEVPSDWDSSTAIDLTLHIYTNEAFATRSGEVRFKIYWSAIGVNAGEAVDAPTHSGTATGADLNIDAVAKAMQEYEVGSIAAASLGVNDSVSLKLERIALTAGTNPTAEPVVIFMEYSYIANSLGYAL